MAESTRPARWRCPSCGTDLEPVGPSSPDVQRLRCPGCNGRFRVRRRGDEPSSATFSGEIPAVPRESEGEPPTVGGFDLAIRGVLLRALDAGYRAGNILGGAAVFAMGGFVPVARGWMRDEIVDAPGVLRALGGVPIATASTDPDADYGPVIARGDAPELFTEVGEVARRLGAKPPEQIRLTYLPCCGVVAGRRARALLLGLPLLHVLTRAELRAVLAHEMAHLARGDATASARSSRFVQGLAAALDAPLLEAYGPLGLWARGVRVVADRLHAPVSRGQEARADRLAATLAGGDATASALVKIAAVQPLFREVLDAYDPSDPDSPNLYAFFREFWDRVPESLLTAIRHRVIRDGDAPTDPAHPPLLDRLAAVQSYPARPGSESDASPASTTVGDLEAMEQMLHNRLFASRAVEPSVFHRAGS